MKTNKITAKIIGTLFIIATIAYSISVFLLDPILGSSDYLTIISANQNLVIISALLILIDAIAVASISIIIYPILKKHSNVLALGYVGARIAEAIFFMMNAITTLILLALSQEFMRLGVPDASYYQIFGTVLLSAGNWFYLIGLGLIFAISALILNFVLYKSKLIPRWISGLGFIGALLVLANYFLEFFGTNPIEILFIPIAIQEMIFAAWLIFKGFNSSEMVSDTKNN